MKNISKTTHDDLAKKGWDEDEISLYDELYTVFSGHTINWTCARYLGTAEYTREKCALLFADEKHVFFATQDKLHVW